MIYPDREAELIAAYETREDRLQAMKAAQRAKFQYGNESTQQVLYEILSQMKQQNQHPDDDRKIGFRHNSGPIKTKKRTGLPGEKKMDEKLLRLWEEIEERNQGNAIAELSDQFGQKNDQRSD